MAVRNRDDWVAALRGGVFAGVLGGIVVALFTMVGAMAAHQDIWIGTKLAGAPFLGSSVVQPGFESTAVAVGVATHFAIAIGWGLAFAASTYGLSKPTTLALGGPLGLAVWIVMFHVVMPAAGLSHFAKGVPLGRALLEHLLFGLAVAVGFMPHQHDPRPYPRTA